MNFFQNFKSNLKKYHQWSAIRALSVIYNIQNLNIIVKELHTSNGPRKSTGFNNFHLSSGGSIKNNHNNVIYENFNYKRNTDNNLFFGPWVDR